MYVHTKFSTWLVIGLVSVTGGLWVPIIILLKQVNKYQIRRAGEVPALCDCCGSYYPSTELTPFTNESGERVGFVCERAVDVPREAVQYALEAPMTFKYLH